MTAEQFAYWLQGFSELNDGEAPSPAQWSSIQDHLKLVFTKVTPPVYQPNQSIWGNGQTVPLTRTDTIC